MFFSNVYGHNNSKLLRVGMKWREYVYYIHYYIHKMYFSYKTTTCFSVFYLKKNSNAGGHTQRNI